MIGTNMTHEIDSRVTALRICICIIAMNPLLATAQSNATDEDDLAKQLANPISSLISVPIQFNYDQNIGTEDDGDRVTINIQPVVPFKLSEDWNLISRTILPIISQSDIAPGAGSQNGFGDIVQSFWFSPAKPTASGWILGGGAAFLLPTGSDDLLTADKWAAGPTAIALKQKGPWTYGALVNQLWSFAGESSRADVNSTFMQPFLVYNTQGGVSYTLQTETAYNWEDSQWSIPLVFGVGKVTKFGNQPVQFFAGVRYWADSAPSGPEGFGIRLNMIFLYPK
jgi:hypothetical protein